MANIPEARRALVARILEGEGTATHALRRAAFDTDGLDEPVRTLVRKVAERAHTVTDEGITRARQSG